VLPLPRKSRELAFPGAFQTLHPFKPYTLHPTPYTLHPTPFTLHRTPYALTRTPYALAPHPTPYTLHPIPHTLILYTLQVLLEVERRRDASHPRCYYHPQWENDPHELAKLDAIYQMREQKMVESIVRVEADLQAQILKSALYSAAA